MESPPRIPLRPEMGAIICLGLVIGVGASFIAAPRLKAAFAPQLQAGIRTAEFGAATPSADAKYVANWVAASQDNAGIDFLIVDKKNARIDVFDAGARHRAWTPVLLGFAAGDDTVPGIGSKSIAEVKAEERTTPAGRFLGERGHNLRGEDVVWVDYEAGVSIHRVLTTNADERRLERLATPTVDDNRISYGCINVPSEFFEFYIAPIFSGKRAVIYVLPEVKPVQQLFGDRKVNDSAARAQESYKNIGASPTPRQTR